MMLGTCMKGMNAIHFKSKVDFFFEFVPQFFFMAFTFLWMDIMIIIKWVTNWENVANKAPGIIGIMINFPLKLGKVCVEDGDLPLFGTCNGEKTIN